MNKATQRPVQSKKPELLFWLDEDPETGHAETIGLNEIVVRNYAAENRISFEKARRELGRQQSGGM